MEHRGAREEEPPVSARGPGGDAIGVEGKDSAASMHEALDGGEAGAPEADHAHVGVGGPHETREPAAADRPERAIRVEHLAEGATRTPARRASAAPREMIRSDAEENVLREEENVPPEGGGERSEGGGETRRRTF
jgi:hypothetical protein